MHVRVGRLVTGVLAYAASVPIVPPLNASCRTCAQEIDILKVPSFRLTMVHHVIPSFFITVLASVWAPRNVTSKSPLQEPM